MNNKDSYSLKKSAQKVQEVLNSYHIGLQVVEFPETTRTAQQAADAIGCTVAQIAKSLIFKGANSGKAVLVIASGAHRVDEKKIATYLGEPIERADAAFVLEQTGYAIGGVPPVGHAKKLITFIDEHLMDFNEIWAAAGTPFAVFKLTPEELVTITQGTVVSVV